MGTPFLTFSFYFFPSLPFLFFLVVAKQSCRSEKVKTPVKDQSSVISLDDLLVEKFGAEGSGRLKNSTLASNHDIHSVKGIYHFYL